MRRSVVGLMVVGAMWLGTLPAAAHETIFDCRQYIDIGPTAVDASMCVRVNHTAFQSHEALTLATKESNPAGTTLFAELQNIQLWLDDDGGSHSDKMLVRSAAINDYSVPTSGIEASTSTAADETGGCDQWQAITTWRWHVFYSGGNFHTSIAAPLVSNWTAC